jgi:hypothetical protein
MPSLSKKTRPYPALPKPAAGLSRRRVRQNFAKKPLSKMSLFAFWGGVGKGPPNLHL